jgi:UDP-glucose 4-epimerase
MADSTFTREPVLVIGGLGFLGTNLTARLVRLGATVTVLTPVREHHAEAAEALERNGVRIVEGDLRHLPLMRELVKGQRLVANLAGQSGAVRSMEDPWTDLDVNLRGTLVVLEALREINREALYLCAGSRLEYGRPTALPAPETALGDPLCLHAIHKRTVEEYLRLYHTLFGLRYVVARVTNPYGPGQPRGRTAYGVINRMIQLAVADHVIPIFGDGIQRRDYIHVDDVVDAFVALASQQDADDRIFNVGTGSGTRLIDLASQVIALAGGGRVEHVPWPPLAEQIETGDFIADVSRIRAEVGWQPSIDLATGLARTVAFYKESAA